MATITLRKGKNLVDVFRIEKDEILIGREKDNDIVIPDKSVSRKHLKITKRFDGYYLEDLGSANGTYFKNEKITEKILETGDIIYIGTTGINIFFEDELSKREDYQPTIADVTRFIEFKEAELKEKGEPFELDLSKFEEKRMTEKPKKAPEKKEKRSPVRIILYLLVFFLLLIVILSVLPKKGGEKKEAVEKKEVVEKRGPASKINVPIKDLTDYNMLQKKINALSSEGEQFLSVCESNISKLTTENTKENRELLSFLSENISNARSKITESSNLAYQSKKGFSEDIFNAIEAGKAREETITFLMEKNEKLSIKLEELQRKIDEIKNSLQAKIGEEASNLLEQARTAFQRGKYQECIDLTNKVLEIDPQNSSAKELQDSAVKKVEETKKAQMERAQREIQIKKSYDSLSTHYRLGVSYIQRDRLFMGLQEWDYAQKEWNTLKSLASPANTFYQEAEKLIRDINSRYMGIAQKRKERISEAIRLYREGERYREIDSKKALQYYREVLEVLKDPDEEYFQKAKKRIQAIEEIQ
jgi:pSer/pThr/pTyr-binding forkhead associated (FHA) protein/tetratricopeptide (TPR) repeat protein